MRSSVFRIGGAVLLLVAPLAVLHADAAPIVFQSSGNDAAAIQAQVDAFRAAVGNPNNGNTPGPLGSGRREINWDGGGTATTVSGTPFNGFQNNRGAQFATSGTGFIQALDTGVGTQVGNATYGSTFEAFSTQPTNLRLFSPLGSNVTDVRFFVPGTAGAVPATVGSFGAIFSDVDLANTTSLAFFGLGDVPLGTFFAPNVAAPGANLNQTFSFLGVQFNAGEQIARIRITTGNFGPGPNDSLQSDVVLMDDVIYGEPATSVPEPGTMTLLALGLAGARFARRRR
jgi:hypothetical protein